MRLLAFFNGNRVAGFKPLFFDVFRKAPSFRGERDLGAYHPLRQHFAIREQKIAVRIFLPRLETQEEISIGDCREVCDIAFAVRFADAYFFCRYVAHNAGYWMRRHSVKMLLYLVEKFVAWQITRVCRCDGIEPARKRNQDTQQESDSPFFAHDTFSLLLISVCLFSCFGSYINNTSFFKISQAYYEVVFLGILHNMRFYFSIGGVLVGVFLLAVSFGFLRPNIFSGKKTAALETAGTLQPQSSQKSIEERIRDAEDRSSRAKGVYMTAIVANDPGRAATRLRTAIEKLLNETELNAVVIDVKETEGLEMTPLLDAFIKKLHEKNVWVVARLPVFRDNSQIREHPEMYIKTKSGAIWRDNKRNAWLDPASQKARGYILDIAKQVIGRGFDEVQFDYIRFPSDGNMKDIAYPAYDIRQPKHEVLKSFFSYLHDGLKAYKPEIMLSADLFGYVAVTGNDLGIGQRLEDINNNFDYISFMLYPSHYYSGFQARADPARNMPEVFYPYRSKNISLVVSNHPSEVVMRSLYIAEDVLAGKYSFASSTMAAKTKSKESASSTAAVEIPLQNISQENAADAGQTKTKLRPWLQAFDLGVDTSRGIVYDAAKVRAQINAAEQSGASGWMLWNPSNVYDPRALHAK